MRRAPNKDDDSVHLEMQYSSTHDPSAQGLIASDPDKHGVLLKRKRRFLGMCQSCCADRWQERYCILVGRYLFCFEDNYSEKAKGTPVSNIILITCSLEFDLVNC
jgi:hypothetical protein